MNKISNEIKIGLLVVAATVIAIMGYRFMKDLPVLQPNNVFYVVYPNVEGLTTGRSIYLNGVDVGKVNSIELLASDSVLVGLSLDQTQQLPFDTKAYLRSIDLLGTKAIALEKGTSPQMLPIGGRIKGVFDEDALGELTKKGISISENLDETIVSTNSVVKSVDSLLSPARRADIEKVIMDVRYLTTALNETIGSKKQEIEQTIESLNRTMANADTLSNNSKIRVDSLLAKLEASSEELDEIAMNVKNVTGELDILLKKINAGEGSLGKLVNDPALYNNLDSLSSNLNDIMAEFKENPKRYLKHMKLIRLF
jgi:ABC-type transporter Mla subunit MlaD